MYLQRCYSGNIVLLHVRYIIIAAMFMYICSPYTNEKAYNYIHVSG